MAFNKSSLIIDAQREGTDLAHFKSAGLEHCYERVCFGILRMDSNMCDPVVSSISHLSCIVGARDSDHVVNVVWIITIFVPANF